MTYDPSKTPVGEESTHLNRMARALWLTEQTPATLRRELEVVRGLWEVADAMARAEGHTRRQYGYIPARVGMTAAIRTAAAYHNDLRLIEAALAAAKDTP